MRKWLPTRNRRSPNEAPVDEPFIATPDWEKAAATLTIIDVDDFEAAHDNPQWRRFCEDADKLVEASLGEREFVAH